MNQPKLTKPIPITDIQALRDLDIDPIIIQRAVDLYIEWLNTYVYSDPIYTNWEISPEEYDRIELTGIMEPRTCDVIYKVRLELPDDSPPEELLITTAHYQSTLGDYRAIENIIRISDTVARLVWTNGNSIPNE